MIARLIRIVASFAIVLTAYGVYAVAVVPLIEPSTELAAAQTGPANRIEPREVAEAPRADLQTWFSPGDWELTSPKILETSKGKLLFQTYRVLPDGKVAIQPCTLILTPEGTFADEPERLRRAIILRAPGEGVLEFAEPFDLRKAKISRVVGGKLSGPIVIRSDQRQVGPEDDLLIVTRDVELANDKVTTSAPIEFHLGANHGFGRELVIELVPSESGEGSMNPGFGGVRSLELRREVRMRLAMEGKGLLPGAPVEHPQEDLPPPIGDTSQRQPAAAQPAGPHSVIVARAGTSETAAKDRDEQPPVEVTCQGPFRVEMDDLLATFHDQVDVVRLNPNGTSDQLVCDLLSLQFGEAAATDAGKPAADGAAPSAKRPSRLEVEWLEARGDPVMIHSPSSGAEVRGQIVHYDVRLRAVTVLDDREAIVTRGTDEIHAPQLHLATTPEGGIASFRAEGAGWLKGIMPAKDARAPAPAANDPRQAVAGPSPEAKPFTAKWTQGVRFRPHEGLFVLSLEGDAYVALAEMGSLEAQGIHVWFRQAAVDPDAPKKPGRPALKLSPDRMMANGHVRMNSETMAGEVETLKLWFVEGPANPLPPVRDRAPGAAPRDNLPPPAEVAGRGGPRGNREADLPGAGRRHFHIKGETLQVEIIARADNKLDLSRANVQGNVRVVESATAEPGVQPMALSGDVVDIVQTAPGVALATIHGAPAHVEARGMTLEGPSIRLDQAANLLEVQGAGRMRMPVEQQAIGMSGGGQSTLDATWEESLVFDGLTAVLKRKVYAAVDAQALSTNFMQITLQQPIHFREGAQSVKPLVETMVCREDVMLDRATQDAQGRLSDERLHVPDLAINQRTGDVQAHGQGWLRSVRRGAPTVPLSGPAASMLGANRPQSDGPPASANDLTYLSVTFRRGITGNIRQRDLTFHEQVVAVYGPVATWEGSIDPDGDPVQWDPRILRMEADELNIAQLESNIPDQSTSELNARGNAIVEASGFTGQAQRIGFSQAKSSLTLEGDGRTDALLQRQKVVGGPLTTVAARKFIYFVDTGNVRIEDAQTAGGQFP